MSGPYSIGGSPWEGLSKLIEEAGEVIQVGGKILGTGGEENHWDGTNLREEITKELADLRAAIDFFVIRNDLDKDKLNHRYLRKMETYGRWADNEDPAPKNPEEAVAMKAEERSKGHHSGACPYPMTNCTCGVTARETNDGACCDNERRNINGGCDNCGDPSL